MTAPAEPGQWLLLSHVLGRLEHDSEISAEMRRLMDKIADGRLRIRYFNADDPILYAPVAEKGPHPRTGHRYEKLPEEFFLSGTPNWKFSMVTLGERTIHQIEVFFPDFDASGNARDEPNRTGAPGRPTSKHLIEDEAKRRLDSGAPCCTLKTFAAELAIWLRHIHPKAPKMTPRTVENAVRDLWQRRNENPTKL
jgi:hypothetical protein